MGSEHSQGSDMLTADQLWQIFLFLFFRTVAVDLIDTEVGVRPVREAHGSGCAADFFHCNGMGQVAHINATVFFFNGDAQ